MGTESKLGDCLVFVIDIPDMYWVASSWLITIPIRASVVKWQDSRGSIMRLRSDTYGGEKWVGG